MNRCRLTVMALLLLAVAAPGYAAGFDDEITIQVIEDLDRGARGASYLDLPDFSSQEARDALRHAREHEGSREREQESGHEGGERDGDEMDEHRDEHGEEIGESRDDGSGGDWQESRETRDGTDIQDDNMRDSFDETQQTDDLREEMEDDSETHDEMDD